MEDAGRPVVYPTLRQVCDVNRRMVEEFGGFFVPPDNLHNHDALEYVLEAIGASVHGQPLHDTLKEKAAALAHQIISRHVFHDGNKRTGVFVAWEFLRANGVKLDLDRSVVELTVALATGNAAREELLQWLHAHQESQAP
ncbi:MAG: type II toxin-antitoxin system death-on-curing family toxin [Chloroflexota bacterium]|nr:type II toxin-antitoxin system death-on-curing family toxin [Chloroflexota bacterium]